MEDWYQEDGFVMVDLHSVTKNNLWKFPKG
jgi:hypothetical protein